MASSATVVPTATRGTVAGASATLPTTGSAPCAVLMRAAAPSPTLKRATCCASRMFTAPSAVTSPRATTVAGAATLSPTLQRATCCASMMFTRASSFTSPQRADADTHSARARARRAASTEAPSSALAVPGVNATRVPPGAEVAVNHAVASVAEAGSRRPLRRESAAVPADAPWGVASSVNPVAACTRTESSVSRVAPHVSVPASEARLIAVPAFARSARSGIPTGAPGGTVRRAESPTATTRVCAPIADHGTSSAPTSGSARSSLRTVVRSARGGRRRDGFTHNPDGPQGDPVTRAAWRDVAPNAS